MRGSPSAGTPGCLPDANGPPAGSVDQESLASAEESPHPWAGGPARPFIGHPCPNPSLCVGFGDCVTVAPDLFVLDDEGIAVFREPSGPVEREVLLEACRACPVDALTVQDEDGRQLAP